MRARLINDMVFVEDQTAGVVLTIAYPSLEMASTAYSFIWECCERFTKEPVLNAEDDTPKIYVFGEMYKPLQFINRLASIAPNIGAIVTLESEKPNV